MYTVSARMPDSVLGKTRMRWPGVALLVDSPVIPASRMEWEGRKQVEMSILTGVFFCGRHGVQ